MKLKRKPASPEGRERVTDENGVLEVVTGRARPSGTRASRGSMFQTQHLSFDQGTLNKTYALDQHIGRTDVLEFYKDDCRNKPQPTVKKFFKIR